MVHVLRGREALEELDRARRPAGDVARQLLEHDRGALAAPVGERVRHVGARADASRRHRPDRPHAEQIADVRHDPFVAGLDEPVVVEDRDVLLDALELALDHAEQRAQRLALIGVAQAVDRREELVEALGHQEAHGAISSTTTPAGLISSSSAGQRRSRRRIPARAESRHRGRGRIGRQRVVGVRQQFVQIDRDHARHRVDERDHLGGRHGLPDVARIEPEARQQRRRNRRQHIGRHIARIDRDLRLQAEVALGVSAGVEALRRVARRADRMDQVRQHVVARQPAGRTGHRQEDARAAVDPEHVAARLADARERARIVLVIEQRDDALEGQQGERRVAARVGEALGPFGAGRGDRVRHAAQAERHRAQHRQGTGIDLAIGSDAAAVARGDVQRAGRQPRALHAVAEGQRHARVVVDARHVDRLVRLGAVERGQLVPQHARRRALRACSSRRRSPTDGSSAASSA